MSRWTPPFSGIWPAMLTPYDADGGVNLNAVRRLVARFIEQGAGGVYVCGSTAEAPLLRLEERKAIAECVISEAAGALPVMVHVGQIAPAYALELAEHADRIGADAISSTLPPFYTYTAGQTADYWKMLARQSDLPFYGYVMHDIGSSMPAVQEWVNAILRVPTLAGIKFTHESAYQLALLKQCGQGALNILAGADQAFLACRAQGADGAIGSCYNVALPVWRYVDQLFQTGDTAAASELMIRCAELVGRFISRYFLVKLKAVIARQGIDCGTVRPPLHADVEIPLCEIDELQRLLGSLMETVQVGAPE